MCQEGLTVAEMSWCVCVCVQSSEQQGSWLYEALYMHLMAIDDQEPS